MPIAREPPGRRPHASTTLFDRFFTPTRLSRTAMQGLVANGSFAYTHVFVVVLFFVSVIAEDTRQREVKQRTWRFENSVDGPALLLPPRSPQPILDNRTATPLTVRDFDLFYTKRLRTCRSVMDSRSRTTLQLPQHHATKYRVTLLWSSPVTQRRADEPLGSYYSSMNRTRQTLGVCTLRHIQ
jgi:hypothetical protein